MNKHLINKEFGANEASNLATKEKIELIFAILSIVGFVLSIINLITIMNRGYFR